MPLSHSLGPKEPFGIIAGEATFDEKLFEIGFVRPLFGGARSLVDSVLYSYFVLGFVILFPNILFDIFYGRRDKIIEISSH